ncbi:hypothetical protein Nepgr_023115 [Nepenthes gracilis]|uniref:Uncharacterized protein n=1 Tax=Nepenthes gracilis TaxID=150966 RepID=A0AAD3T044_NEPGR|nr:hypothetical protein Nepgr_023115 [Nepenthes gracilis]
MRCFGTGLLCPYPLGILLAGFLFLDDTLLKLMYLMVGWGGRSVLMFPSADACRGSFGVMPSIFVCFAFSVHGHRLRFAPPLTCLMEVVCAFCRECSIDPDGSSPIDMFSVDSGVWCGLCCKKLAAILGRNGLSCPWTPSGLIIFGVGLHSDGWCLSSSSLLAEMHPKFTMEEVRPGRMLRCCPQGKSIVTLMQIAFVLCYLLWMRLGLELRFRLCWSLLCSTAEDGLLWCRSLEHSAVVPCRATV